MQYPKWRFHPTAPEKIVTDEAHEVEAAPAEDGWVNHPSEFPEAEPEAEPEAKKPRKR